MSEHLSRSDTDHEQVRSTADTIEPWAGVSTEVLGRLVNRLPVPFEPRAGGNAALEPDEVARASPASYLQTTAWTRAQRAHGEQPHIIPRAYRLRGSLDCDALARSLNVLIRRHEALRTTFAPFDGSLAQVVAARGMALFRQTDLANLPREDREYAVRRLLRRELRRPFDLYRGPMLRALLLRIDCDDHVLMLSMPAIVGDWWSIGLLWRELGNVYTNVRDGRPVDDASSRSRPSEVVQAEVVRLGVTERASFAEYWRRVLDGPRLDLPRDRVGPPASGAPRGRVEFTLGSGTTEALQALAITERGSVYMVLLAAYASLLRRYTGQDDLQIGSPVSHRVRPELERAVGALESLGAVRIETGGAPTFRQLIGRARTAALDAYAHQGLAALAPADSIAANQVPGLETALSLRGAPGQPPAMADLTAELLRLEDGAPIFDLMVHFELHEGTLVGVATFRADMFARGTIERLFQHFVMLLEGALADPDRPIDALPMLSAAERRRALTLGRGPVRQADEDATVWSLFENQSARSPGAPALECGEEVRTYCEVRTDARAIARALRAHGVGSGSRVGVVLGPSALSAPAMLGVLAAGAAVVPLDAAATQERVHFVLQDAEPAVILVGEIDDLDLRVVGDASILRVRELLDAPLGAEESAALHVPMPGEAAFVVYTESTDARPTGVVIEHQSLVSGVEWHHQEIHAGSGVRVTDSPEARLSVPWLPLLPLLSGATYVFGRTGGGSELASLIARAGVGVVRLDGPSLRDLLDETTSEVLAECRALRRVVCDGRGLTPSLIELFYRRARNAGLADVRLHSVYGWPETADDGAGWACPPADEAPPVMLVGRAAANARLYVVDDRGTLCPVGVPGEVWIGGSPVARGYLGRANLTAERFFPDPFARGGRVFRTGDRARWRTDGQLERLGSFCL